LKQREAKKVIERSEQVVTENSLQQIHESARKTKSAYDQCLSDRETETLVQEQRDIRKKGKANRTLLDELRAELKRAVENERQTEEQISSLLREIQGLARKLTGGDLTLQLA
jgi:flagellar biosynthesis GTPase FlhF